MQTEQTEETVSNIQLVTVFTSDDTGGFQQKKWFFTYYIKSPETFEMAFERLKLWESICNKWIWGEEYGKSGETPHIQGACIMDAKMRSKTISDNYFLNGVTLRKLRNWNAAFIYCQKECNKVVTNQVIPEPIVILQEKQLFKWQKCIIELILTKPKRRRIYWYWGKQGVGKTQFIKYLIVNYKAILLNGKPSDMKNGIIEYMKKNNNSTPKLILSNIGYDKCLASIHYSGYEDIKDMCFYSGKYEGGMVCGNNPHLLIFANGPPTTTNIKFHVHELIKY